MKLNDLPKIDAALAPQAISTDVLLEKYAKGTESSAEDIHHRVSTALAAVEQPADQEHWQARFLAALARGFIPAGRINSAGGTDIRATLINCFVQPVGDSVSEDVAGKPSIYKALAQAAETMRRGGGVGYDFSRIRPRGAMVKGTHSNASGPVSYMRVFDRSCETVESAGARRGAQMGILRCDHPDLDEFIHAKDDNGLANFNISVGVTDAFMQAVEDDAEFELVHPAQPGAALIEQGAHQRPSDGLWVYRTVRARALMDDIVHATYDHADPGVVFLDRMNQENNLWYVEVIEATNPCSEQSLPDYGCCCLGSIDLTRFVERAFESDAGFDWTGFKDVVRTAVRMLDNVLEVTWWPLPEQRREAMAKRRIGLGFLGLGSALVMLGIRYDSEQGLAFGARVAQAMRDEAYRARSIWPPRRGRFRRSMRSATCRAGSPGACPTTSAARWPNAASATAICCRSRPRARSHWPSRTTRRTASSRRSPGATRAGSAWPTVRPGNTRSRITPTGCSGSAAATSCACPPHSCPRWT
jgi:ribonucleoside-diphosphate reductase alpha chain